ncbi:MAG: OmpA family protein [Bacteroidota bacterium]|nr:OmpA family protein [Bacteroidota bacterium]
MKVLSKVFILILFLINAGLYAQEPVNKDSSATITPVPQIKKDSLAAKDTTTNQTVQEKIIPKVIPVIKPAPNDSMGLLEISVKKSNGEILPGQPITIENISTKQLYTATSDEQGNIYLLVPVGQSYNVKYKNFGVDTSYRVLDVPKTNKLVDFKINIVLNLPRVYVLKNVLFDLNKATFKKKSTESLNDLIEVMKAMKSIVIEIAGHTDNVGNKAKNLKLSKDRANAVRTYLIKKGGIEANRIVAEGYGDSKPRASNKTAAGRAENRRTEVLILSGF